MVICLCHWSGSIAYFFFFFWYFFYIPTAFFFFLLTFMSPHNKEFCFLLLMVSTDGVYQSIVLCFQ